MKRRIIFKKKKSFKKIVISSLFVIILLLFFIFYLTSKNEFLVIPKNNESFYIIPEDRGGEKVANLDKKSLNLKSIKKSDTLKNDAKDLPFSVQFYSSNDLVSINNYLNKITKSKENIYYLEDFFILALNTDIGLDYFLLYKKFATREAAKNYCLKFLTKIERCLIVDVTKF